MAKKKKSHKKQQFKYATPSVAASKAHTGAAPLAPAVAATSPAKGVNVSYEVANLNLIKGDVRKVAVLAVSFVVLQLILWFLFEHTGLGPAVYHLIKL